MKTVAKFTLKIIAKDSEYEIETKGKVVLGPGFMVEKGANFSVSRRND